MQRAIIIIAIVLCLSACRKVDLYHDLSEEEANEILVALQQEGISVGKVKEVRQNEVFWTVQVDRKRIADARRLLVEHHLPHKSELGLSGVYKEKGLIPTPDEQKARYLLALKGEIINSLKKIPDVVDADAILNIPSPEEFASPGAEPKRPTASVVVKARVTDSAQASLSESKIQQFVANTVENLNPRDVSVIITYAAQSKSSLLPGQTLVLPSARDVARADVDKAHVARIAGIEVVTSSQNRLKIYLVVFFVMIAAMAAGLVAMVIKTSRQRQELDDFKGPETRALVEGNVVEEKPKLK